MVPFGSSKDSGASIPTLPKKRVWASRKSTRHTRLATPRPWARRCTPRGPPRHGRQAPPPAARGPGLPHPQDLVGRRPQQRRRQGPAGLRRERPDGHDGHKRRRRPGRRPGGRGPPLLGPDKQRRRGLPAQLQARGQDPVGPDIHGLPARDRGHPPRWQHPRHPRLGHPLRRDDIDPEGRPALREHSLRLRARRHPGGGSEAPAGTSPSSSRRCAA